MNTEAAAYGEARAREGRLLADELVRGLPLSGQSTPHAHEWAIRTNTMRRVLRLFARADRPLRTLDVGCGNGWFAARLAQAGHQVTAIDTHRPELEQAQRVFAHLPVHWMEASPLNLDPAAGPFDRILLAASVQYFHELPGLITHLRSLLAPEGEVHVMDTVLYPDVHAAQLASERSQRYYAQLGVPAMAAHYHHHTLAALLDLGGSVVSRPGLRPVAGFPPWLHRDPFHHIVLPAASSRP